MVNVDNVKTEVGDLIRYIDKCKGLDYSEYAYFNKAGLWDVGIKVYHGDDCILSVHYEFTGEIEVVDLIKCSMTNVKSTQEVIDRFLKEWAI